MCVFVCVRVSDKREKNGLSNILVKPMVETGARKRAGLTMSEKNVPVKAKTGYMKDNKKGRGCIMALPPHLFSLLPALPPCGHTNELQRPL